MPSGSHFSRRDLFSLTSFGTFAGVAALARPVTGESAEVEALSAPGPDREKTGVLYETASGPWGDLTYYYFYLEAPMHLIDAFPVRTLKTRWAVPLQYEAEFRAVLETLPLSSAQRGALFAPDNLGLASTSAPVFITVTRAVSAPLNLQVLHASDFEAGIPALEDAIGFSRVLNALRAEITTNTLTLSSGDNYIPGPFFTASADPAVIWQNRGK